jgi:hypothetical protein
MSGGEPSFRQEFKDRWLIAEVLRVQGTLQQAQLLQLVSSESAKRNADMLAAIEEIGISTVDGRIKTGFAHHRSVNWSNPAILGNYNNLKVALSQKQKANVYSYY